MRYVYKNQTGRSININGYQFGIGQELRSNIIIERFNEAVTKKFLSLKDSCKPVLADKVKDNLAEKDAQKEAVRKAEEARLAEEAKKAEEERLIKDAETTKESANEEDKKE